MEVDFGKRLCEIRKRQGYTQERLADLIGVAKSTVTGYEKGYREPNIATIKKLARIFGISIDELLGFDGLWFPNRATGEDETKLLDDYREMNQQGQEYIR